MTTFSFVIIPDTQELSENYSAIYTKMCQWITTQSNELNIKMVLHLGDLVNDATSKIQFQNASNALKLINDANIPLLISPGNHDYDNLLMKNRDSKLLNKYFGIHQLKNNAKFIETFEKDNIENSYARIRIGSQNFLFISLEFGPRKEVLTWFDNIVSKYNDHKVILITHSYMYIDGSRTNIEDNLNPKSYPGSTDANTGEEMWEKSLKKHSNLIAVFSGHHVPENVSYRIELGEKGNPVLQSFQNWQMEKNGGEGRLRMATFHPLENKLSLKVYNPHQKKFENEAGYEFDFLMGDQSLKYPLQFPTD